MKILEVIVCTLADALEAEAGGAGRLEIVRDLPSGGLTPDFSLAFEICSAVSIPVRIMIRENPSMAVAGEAELSQLCRQAAAFGRLGIDGLVLGFIKDGQIDVEAMNAILSAAPHMRVTFHRAFDCLSYPILAVQTLKSMSQIDRLLTSGGPGSWAQRKLRLQHLQRLAHPEINLLAAAGLDASVIRDLVKDPVIQELHVGRAARNPPDHSGLVAREKVAQLRK